MREFTFAEFVDFVFDRDPPPATEDRIRRWYYTTKCIFDPVQICGYYARLFEQAGHLLKRFSYGQLEMGFSALESCTFACSALSLIWSSDVPLADREQCVRSMFHLFQDLFAVDPLGFTANMWWDVFCYDYELGRRKRSRGGVDLWMQEVMFETLFAILVIDSEECRNAALHGLSHLHHPGTLDGLKRCGLDLPFIDDAWCLDYKTNEARWERDSSLRYPD
jgi:hypothetical protein